jgi:hypothetical protein
MPLLRLEVRVAAGQYEVESALQAMQTLINQAVSAGAMCVLMLESSHVFRGDTPVNPAFRAAMDQWFDHWHRREGPKNYLGLP